ncbi:LRR receptor-like serine/threonine-protein kinase [Pyrus ussuriensis x Pyrus communis]|uniref:non-specific serine/threonine protein kinase n=1 Tax=Pyrus ussuriensis x Pyrus communis TaxID=2448454 RepID=A0A5N5GIW9_9ROSA|nr:LRR receptor-like serine/threonine-protein kinase [Pyrus ussuriensis x Pyrus communis]
MERSHLLLSRMLSMIHCLCYIYMMIMANYLTVGALVIAHTNFSTDQFALLTLKAHITSDPQNILTANWSFAFNSNICNWVGLTCGARHHRVTALNLSFMGLAGVIPPHLCNLSFLVELGLTNNFFNGPLPQELSRLRRLKGIDFQYNNFTGTIPSWFGSFPKLQTFILRANGFFGFIPAAIFNLSALERINLSRNQPSELPNEIGSLGQLEELFVQYNALKGYAFVHVLNISSLTTFTLFGNYKSGNLPDNICEHLLKLREILLGFNNFRGSIPKNLGNLTYLSNIFLHDNSLEVNKFGEITLSSNQLSGGLLANIGLNVPNLEFLYVARNNLVAGLLPNLSNASKLRELDMSVNSFTEFLPITLYSLKNLEYLNLNLTRLSLAENPLNTTIPASRGNISTSLVTVDLSISNIKGNIPLSGAILTLTPRLQNLQVLYLNDNELRGHIPYELYQLNNLAELRLDGNQLSGSIISCLGTLSVALRSLSLGSNLLTSKIPSSLWELKYISYLNLSSNSLVGPLSKDIRNLGGLLNMINFSLANSKLEGRIPSSFETMLSLDFLDLSKNNLSGEIPKSLEALLRNSKWRAFWKLSVDSFVSNGALYGASQLCVPWCKNRTKVKPNWRKAKHIISGVISKRNVEVVRETTSLHQVLWIRVSHLELLKATNGFHESNLLGTGEGGFGLVYKGTLSDGIDIAIKVFNLQLEGASKSFDKECEMLSNIRHQNLIKIISCCDELDFKALILQLMPNGSLENWLYSPYRSLTILQRLDIMKDVALALEYLHHVYSIPIVHYDVKPSNILLDDDMVAHVADFGIARLIGGGDSMTETITLATVGYMAPEFGMEGSISTRGDVYSFGIVLMETFTKRKPTDEMFVGEMDLKQWIADSLFPDAATGEVVNVDILRAEEDSDFMSKKDCLSSIMRLALACSAALPGERINMKDAAITLTKIKTKYLKDCGEVNS